MYSRNEKLKMSRQKLYELVWSKPTTILAGEIGISDVMIAKICKKHRIPKPGLGYWARFENGHKDPVSPLPKINTPHLENIEITIKPADPQRPELSASIKELIANEDLAVNQIQIAERLGKLPPLLARAKEGLSRKIHMYNGLASSHHDGLYLRVSRANTERAIKIMSALMSGFEKRGFQFEIKNNHGNNMHLPSVTIQGYGVEFRLQERLKRKRIESLDTIEDKDFRKQLRYGFKPGQEVLAPSGDLYLQIESYTDTPSKKLWSDTEKHRLEDQLNSFVKGLIAVSEGVRLREERSEIERKRRDLEHQEYLKKEADRKAVSARSEALRDLTNKIAEHEKIKALKVELENRLHSVDGMKEETEQLLNWTNEFLLNADPLSHFLTKTIRPLLNEANNS